MHILVTGGAGFIGSHIVEYHLNRGDIVHVLDDLSTGSKENIEQFISNPNFHFTKANLLIYLDIEKIVAWADRIYHLAGVVGIFRVLKEPEKVLSVNIGATERLLRAANASTWKPRIILASTSEVYGNDIDQPLKEDSDLIVKYNFCSRMTYPVSKLAAEVFMLSYYQRFNIPVTVLRFFNTIGPRQTGKYGMVVPRFLKSALLNEPITVFGTGEQMRNFIDVRDATGFIVEVANNLSLVGRTLNIGHDERISINQLAHLIKKLANSDSEIKHISYREAYKEDFEDCMFRQPDLTNLYQSTVYRPQWSLERTLLNLLQIYKSTLSNIT